MSAVIFLVDDDDGSRDAMTRTLERVGYSLRAFPSAEAALEPVGRIGLAEVERERPHRDACLDHDARRRLGEHVGTAGHGHDVQPTTRERTNERDADPLGRARDHGPRSVSFSKLAQNGRIHSSTSRSGPPLSSR